MDSRAGSGIRIAPLVTALWNAKSQLRHYWGDEPAPLSPFSGGRPGGSIVSRWRGPRCGQAHFQWPCIIKLIAQTVVGPSNCRAELFSCSARPTGNFAYFLMSPQAHRAALEKSPPPPCFSVFPQGLVKIPTCIRCGRWPVHVVSAIYFFFFCRNVTCHGAYSPDNLNNFFVFENKTVRYR